MTPPESEVESALEPTTPLGSAADMGRAHRARHARLDAIATRLPLMFYTYVSTAEREFQFTYVSPYSAVLTGFTPEEICAQPELLLERFHPEDVPGWRARLEEAKRERRDWFHELRYRHKAGHYIWIRSQAWREYRPDGSFQSVGYWIDISADRMAEDKLRASEQRYRALTECSLAGIAIADSRYRFRFVNASFARMFGYASPEEVLTLPSSIHLVYPEDLPRLQEYHSTRLEGGGPQIYEARGVRKDGSVFWFCNAVSVVEWEGEPATQNVCIDVSEQKRAEEAMRVSEQRYRDLVEGSVQGILVHRDFKPLFVNQAFADIFGFPSREAALAVPDITGTFEPADLEWTRQRNRDQLEGRRVPLVVERQVIRADQSIGWVEALPTVVEWEGEPAFLVSYVDITERKRAERALRESEQRYRDLVEGSLQGMFIHRDFRLLFANPAMAEMMGYDSVESFLAAGDLLGMVAPLERARARCHYELRMSGGNAPERFEIRYSRRDGAEIVLEMQSRVINWNGQPAVQCTAFDITERKRAEQALHDSEKRYRDLIENSVLGILIQRDFKPLFVNRAYAQMFGYGSVREMLALESVEALVHPDNRERLRGYQTARRRGAPAPEQYEFRGLRKDGSVIWVSSHVRQVHWQGLRAHQAVCLDITRQKSAEQALWNSEQRYRDLVEGSLQGMFIRDEKRIVFANQAMADILGFPSAQALVEFGDPLGFYPPHELPRLRRYAESRLRGEPAPPDYECEAHRRDGRMIWAEVRARRVEWEGRPGIQVILHDITDRKRAEQALRESETRFRTLVEGSVQGILVHRDFKPLFVNQAFADIFGFPSREAVLAVPDITGTFEPADLEWTRQRNRDQLEGRRVPLVVERQVIRADGSVGWVEALPTVVEWEGEPAFLVSYVDITERKQAEEALNRNRAYLAAVLDTAADGIVTIDREGIVESFNLAAGRIFGYERAEVIGRNISMLVPTPHRERHQDYIESYLRTGQSRIIGIGRDTLGQRKDGSIFPISIDVSEVRQEERITFTAIIKDITEKKLREQALRETAQAKTVMLSNLSHELRTPLTSVLGFAQVLRREENLTEPQRVDLGIIEESAHHLLELVDDVLEVQRMEAGFLKLHREDFDLHHAVSSLIEMFRPRSEGKQVEILLDIATSVPRYVNGDPRKLRQVLINLIGNAIKFTDQGRIAVELSTEKEGVRFKVRDTGPGISPWDLEEIMKPFRQFSTARGGTGLGLSISKGLVELMGGRLAVDSTVGIGSEFSFALPFGEAGAAFDRARAGVQPAADLPGGARVLIVDDDGALREWLRRTLRAEGYETQEAEDGRAALRRYSEFRPQLILMDMRMPVMGGMEAIRQIRRMEGGADIPILALTADSASVQPAPGEPEAPYQRALTKPVESGRLLEALRELLPARPGDAGGLGPREGGPRAPET